MKTIHKLFASNAAKLLKIDSKTVHLTVTSPPYPMIEMWDDIFTKQNKKIGAALAQNNGALAFELMHREMDKVWTELERVTVSGGFVCINIGDATRTIDQNFQLFSNHTRIIQKFLSLGFQNLPNIIWRKATNAPNKFMGSGMMPPGAYVTLEHEHILIFRKGRKREFKTVAEKNVRRSSSYFWEERNIWFSDLWDLKGVKQSIKNSKTRERSAAYPFELSYRLINMFSVKGDNVLDPYLGTGTTVLGAMAAGRNSFGYDIDKIFIKDFSEQNFLDITDELNKIIRHRLHKHQNFIKERKELKGKDSIKHTSNQYDFAVMTSQEKELILNYVKNISITKKNRFECQYIKEAILEYNSQSVLSFG